MNEKDPMTFEATVQREGSFTFVAIPFSPREVWGARPRYYVTGTINDIPVRGTLGASGPDYFLRLGAAWLRDSGIEPEGSVTVRLSLEGPHAGNLAPDIAEELISNPKARTFFDGLPTFYRKNFISWIETAKHAETRKNRIAEMITLLEEGKRERQKNISACLVSCAATRCATALRPHMERSRD